MPRVRPARAGDAERCAEVHVASWQAAYRGIAPDAYLDGLSAADRLPWWRSRLEQPDEHDYVVVGEDDGQPATVRGFGSVRGDPEHDAVGVVAQVYVEPSQWGAGVGPLLLADLERELQRRGFAAAVLDVARDNGRARRFYEREGWTATGAEHVESVWDVDFVTVRYAKLFRST